MQLLKSLLLASSILAVALPVTPVYAVEVECKRFDTKCNKAQKKAQFTQSYFRIMDAGVKVDWDPKALRESFTKEEQRALKKLGFDVTSRNLVRTLEKKYNEAFADMDPAAWQAVLDSILHEDYVTKQIKYKLMNVAVIDRLKKELENSGKKTVKAKSGNFSTRSSSRPAVVVLEDMRRAQSALMKELSKAGDDLDIDVLAEALEKTTIILVERNEKVAKALGNPKELEKVILKASESSGVEAVQILKQLNVAASPAIQVVKQTAQAKIQKSDKATVIKSKQVAQYKDASAATLTAIITSMDDSNIPALPDDLSSLTRQELKDIYSDATDEDYQKIMREYARYAKLAETKNIAEDVQWQKGNPGMMYNYFMGEVWREGYKGTAAQALIGKLDKDAKDLWALVKDIEARTKNGILALNQEMALEKINIQKTGEEGDENTEEGHLEQLHWDEATQLESAMTQLYTQFHTSAVLSDKQMDYIADLLDDSFKFIKVVKGSDFTNDLFDELEQLAQESAYRLEKDLLLVEQSANDDVISLESNKSYSALAQMSVAHEMVKSLPGLGEDGVTPEEVEAYLGPEAVDIIIEAFIAFEDVTESRGLDKDLTIQAFDLYKKSMNLLVGSSLEKDQEWHQFLAGMEYHIDTNAVAASYQDIMEDRFSAEDAAQAANMAELADEISKIQDAINNIQSEYDKAVSMGASHSEATAYMQDQQAQMQAGMAELCAAGDTNAC